MTEVQEKPLKKFFPDKEGWDARSHRLWLFFNRQDDFFPISFWPKWAQEKMVWEHKPREQRFNLMFFLIGNGVYPPIAAEWVLACDVKAGSLVEGQYDLNAHEDVLGIVKRATAGKLFLGKKDVWDMQAQAVLKM